MATGTQGLLQIRQKRHVVLEVLRFATTFRRHGILPDICKSSVYHGGEGQENTNQSISTPSKPWVDMKDSKEAKKLDWADVEAARFEKVDAVG